MGFAKPKNLTPALPPAPEPAPPPVTQAAPEVVAVQDEQRRRAAMRKGYSATLLAPATATTRKTLLG